MTKLVFPTDEHHPYADMRAIELAQKITLDFNPDIRIAGSDGIDFYSISSFNKDPNHFKYGGLQNEINEWMKAQRAWIDASPNADVFFIIGNHEDRLERYLWKNPEIYGLSALELPNLLNFEGLGIEMASKNGRELVLHDRLLVKHGDLVRKWAGYTARAELEKESYGISTLSGHTHRGAQVLRKTRNGAVTGVEGFCLCNIEPAYVHNPDWQQGLVLATVNDYAVQFELVQFYKKGRRLAAMWRGTEYTA